jgi:prepilin-type processing-associated H-X9-DG protein
MCSTCTNCCSPKPANAIATNGAFQMEQARRWEDFTDGTSHTALASEEISGKKDKSPGVDYRGGWTLVVHGSNYEHYDTPNSSNGDIMYPGTCTNTDMPDMPCGTSTGNDPYRWHNAARSRHPGGVNLVLADGHTNFIPNVVDLSVWQALGARNDGKSLGLDY